MFVSQEKFWSDYRIQNGQAPNETVLNRGIMRLKREIRELKSLIDIVSNQNIEEYSTSAIYEQDEYVMYKGSYYKSLQDHNYSNAITNENFWKLVTLPSIKDGTIKTHFQRFISEPDQDFFKTEYRMSERPMVFIDGILQDTSTYSYNSRSITLNEPLEYGRRVIILYGYSYESAIYLPKREFTAEYNQDTFTVPFQLVEPNVYVNGVLQPERSYTFGRDYVQFPQGLSEGSTVLVANGNVVGVDFYSKVEMDDFLANIYKKAETYSREEVDARLGTKADLAYADVTYRRISDSYSIADTNNILANYVQYDIYRSGLDQKANWGTSLSDYRIEDAYTKSESNSYLDSVLEDQFTNGRLRQELDGKADKATTLSGYYIEDAYTKDEVSNLLARKVDTADYTGAKIVEMIDGLELKATSLEGYTKDQFMRSDVSTSNVGGITVKQNSTSDSNVEIVDDIAIHKYIADTQRYEQNYYRDGTLDMYINIEGEFKGDFDFNILQTGVACPDEYNWTVYVQPVIDGNRVDYIPEKYGNGFHYSKEVNEAKAWEHTFYHFGYVEILGTLTRSFVVHLKSFYRNGELEMIPTPAHYKLVGVRKEGSTFLRFNQGTPNLDDLNVYDDNELEYNKIRYTDTVTNVHNALEDNYTSNRLPPHHVVGHANRYEFTVFDEIQVVFNGLKPSQNVSIAFDQDVEIIRKDEVADSEGLARVLFKYPHEGEVIVSCKGNNSDTGYVKINVRDTYDDDINTTLVFDESVFDHNVFTNGNTKYPLESTLKYAIDTPTRLVEIYENQSRTLDIETDAPNLEISGISDKTTANLTYVENVDGVSKYKLDIVGTLPDELTLTLHAYGDNANREQSIDIVVRVIEVKLDLPERISVPLGKSVQIQLNSNVPAAEITTTVTEIYAEALLSDTLLLTVNGLILGETEIALSAYDKVVKSRVVVYDDGTTGDAGNTEEPSEPSEPSKPVESEENSDNSDEIDSPNNSEVVETSEPDETDQAESSDDTELTGHVDEVEETEPSEPENDEGADTSS